MIGYKNEYIKRLLLEDNFTLLAGQSQMPVAEAITVSEPNVLPVFLRVTLSFILDLGIAVNSGILLNATVFMDDIGGNPLLQSDFNLTSIFKTTDNREFYGSVLMPVTNFYTLRYAGIVSLLAGGGVGENLEGKTTIEFYYEPIRYS